MTSGNDEQVASRILIVDDSEGFRATASALLAARGFELLEPAPRWRGGAGHGDR